jgi:phosphonoacetate hydrolase
LSDAAAGIIDIAPTVLDLLGCKAPASMRGISLISAGAREQVVVPDVFETGSGAFRQMFSVVRRGHHAFPIHGGRVN